MTITIDLAPARSDILGILPAERARSFEAGWGILRLAPTDALTKKDKP